jgi:hypothetical protein
VGAEGELELMSGTEHGEKAEMETRPGFVEIDASGFTVGDRDGFLNWRRSLVGEVVMVDWGTDRTCCKWLGIDGSPVGAAAKLGLSLDHWL